MTQRGRWLRDKGGGHITRAVDRRQRRSSHDEGSSQTTRAVATQRGR